jgi:hypothetical protein
MDQVDEGGERRDRGTQELVARARREDVPTKALNPQKGVRSMTEGHRNW